MFQVANNVSSRLFPFNLAANDTLFLPPAQNLGSGSVSDYATTKASGLRLSRLQTMDLLTLMTSGLPVIQALGLVPTSRLPIRTTILRHDIDSANS
jgi:hypothetical protein